jgi:hypothetical protein
MRKNTPIPRNNMGKNVSGDCGPGKVGVVPNNDVDIDIVNVNRIM